MTRTAILGQRFLCIRRRHARALTLAPKTARGITLRTELDRNWRTDFKRIKQRETAVIESLSTHRLVSL